MAYRRYALVSLLTFSAALVPSVLIYPSICSRKNLLMLLKHCHTIRWLLNKDYPNLKDNPNSALEYLRTAMRILFVCKNILSNRLAKKDVDYALRNYPYKHYYKLTKKWMDWGANSRYPIRSAHPVEYDSRNNGSVAYTINVKEILCWWSINYLESNKLDRER